MSVINKAVDRDNKGGIRRKYTGPNSTYWLNHTSLSPSQRSDGRLRCDVPGILNISIMRRQNPPLQKLLSLTVLFALFCAHQKSLERDYA